MRSVARHGRGGAAHCQICAVRACIAVHAGQPAARAAAAYAMRSAGRQGRVGPERRRRRTLGQAPESAGNGDYARIGFRYYSANYAAFVLKKRGGFLLKIDNNSEISRSAEIGGVELCS